jgi:hypothetical protein
MTITATFSTANSAATSSNAGMIQLVVFTGASSTQGTAASIRNSTTSSMPNQSLTTTVNNSWVFGMVQSWTSSDAPTPGAGQTNTINGSSAVDLDVVDTDSYWVQTTNTTTSTAGTVVTLSDTMLATIVHHFSMVEVVPATPTIDASSPAATTVDNVSTNVTSSSFSPPANSAIFAFFSLAGSSSTAQSVTGVTDNLGTHLNWNLYPGSRDNIFSSGTLTGDAEVWWAYCPSAQASMTVTGTFAVANNIADTNAGGLMQILVFTGAATMQNGNTSIRNSLSVSNISQTLTTSVDNSWVFGVIHNGDSNSSPTIPGGQTDVFNGNNSFKSDGGILNFAGYWVQAHTSITPTASTVVTLNVTAPGSDKHHFSMVEVLPPGVMTAPKIVSTTAVTAITATTATGSGTVEDDGGGVITERGVCWNTSANPTTANSKATAAGTTGSFTANITGLSDGTVYHVRAYAINSMGTIYGNDVAFQNYHAGSFGYIKA